MTPWQETREGAIFYHQEIHVGNFKADRHEKNVGQRISMQQNISFSCNAIRESN